MKLKRTELKAILDSNDIVSVIGRHIKLKQVGDLLTSKCPFHKGEDQDFKVNPKLQIYHCFGCHEGGDAIRFLQRHEHLDFDQAVRALIQFTKQDGA